ncbi:hypothetical protein EYC58_02535 [Candidatus Saccharibacteria bacterium]|nr:MAG: hypothetical protein EYC58_02535 [Candidatus Saccharibacteria bacterium]
MYKKRVVRVPLGNDNFLSVLEGVEGGFAIFAGIIVGLMFEGVSRELLVLTALIGIIVNAFNSSAVRFSSEHYMDELDGHEKRRRFQTYFVPAIIEFSSYLVVSFIALAPLLFVADLSIAVVLTIEMTLVILFVAGWYRGHLLNRRHAVRDGFEVMLLGLLIICVGAFSGWLLTQLI